MKSFDWIYRLSRWGIGFIFVYAGTVKLLNPEVFAVLIDAYGILPEKLVTPVALCLPVFEILAGIGLMFDIYGSLSVITGLLLLFMVILAYGIRMGLDVDCGCFGPEDPEAEAFKGLRATLYRDMLMLAVIVFLFGWRRYRVVRPIRIKTLIKNLSKTRRTKDAYVQGRIETDHYSGNCFRTQRSGHGQKQV